MIAKRPTGEVQMNAGYALFSLTLAAIIIGGLSEPDSQWRFWSIIAASAMFSLGLIMWGVGYIVHAIWFLHGDEQRSYNDG